MPIVPPLPYNCFMNLRLDEHHGTFIGRKPIIFQAYNLRATSLDGAGLWARCPVHKMHIIVSAVLF